MTILIVLSFGLMLAGLPIAFVIGLFCLGWMVFFSDFPLVAIPQRMFGGMDVWTFLAVPLFVFAGDLMNHTGITERLIRFVSAFIGHVRSGLSLVCVGTSMVFAGVSGTAVGDAAAIGGVLIPAMKKEGYSAEYSAAVVASASVVGPIIPPSVSMVITATMLNLSVGRLFLAGLVPGLLLGLGFAIVAYVVGVRQGHPKGQRASWNERIAALGDAALALCMPLIIVGGIICGVFTPTEAAGIAVLYALIVGCVIYRTLPVRRIPRVLLSSLRMSVPIMVLIGLAMVFSWILIAERVPQQVGQFLFSITRNPVILLLIINAFLLVIGMFLETNAAILVLFPVLFKLVPLLGMNPIHFAMMVLLNLFLGLLTPPLGVCLFITVSIGRADFFGVVRQMAPFMLVALGVLVAVTYIPAISLYIPGLFFG